MVFSKRVLSDLVIEDIEGLITAKVAEGKHVDYKQEIDLAKDNEKGEFLADISSFANTNGGYLIYGVKEIESIPTEIVGCEIDDLDKLKQQITHIVLGGIQPKVYIDIHIISIEYGKHVLVIKIQNSYNQPHRVIFKQSSKHKNEFYGRNSAGKYQLDTIEIGDLFLQANNLENRIKDFVAERLIKIKNKETFVNLKNDCVLILHVIPLQAFNTGFKIDLSKIITSKIKVETMGRNSINNRANFDGCLVYDNNYYSKNEESTEYTQIFRNGIIESTLARITTVEAGIKNLHPIYIGDKLIKSVTHYLRVLKELNLTGPTLLNISILHALGTKIRLGQEWLLDNSIHALEKDDLLFQSIFLDKENPSIESELHYLFDQLWQAFGFEKCTNYNIDGKRVSKNY